MTIKTQVKDHPTVAVLGPEDEISQKSAFVDQVERLREGGFRHFVIDLANELKMDAAGVGALIVAWKDIHAGGGDMKLVHNCRRTRRVLQATRADSIFETYATPEQAIASLRISVGSNETHESERRRRAGVVLLSDALA